MGHIYQIRNIVNNTLYIGSVLKRNPSDRWIRHRKDLRGNIHHSLHLQRAWNKYGESNFIFEILEEVKSNVIVREQYYIDKNLKNNKTLYNMNLIAGNCEGRKFSKESKKKMSLSHIGIRRSSKSKLKQMKSWEDKCKVAYSFTSPTGIVYNNIKNLRRFAREHLLSHQILRLVNKQTIGHHKGWIKTNWIGNKLNKPIQYVLVSPIGVETKSFILKSLCTNAGLNYKSVHKRCILMNKSYKGWTVAEMI